MSLALAGRVPASFELKSAQLSLLRLRLKSPDLALLAQELQARFGELPDFFDHDPLLIDLSPLPADGPAPDLHGLCALLRQHRLVPVAACGGSPALMAAALVAGLPSGADARDLGEPSDESATEPGDKNSTPASSPPAAPLIAMPASALVIDRPLRAGQQVYARGRDLVVTAMVNPGAEVIADGHIHVYAPLRGRAIAGARGDDGARIFAHSLEAELLAIAGVWREGEAPLPPALAGRPVQVRLDGGSQGRLVIDPLG